MTLDKQPLPQQQQQQQQKQYRRNNNSKQFLQQCRSSTKREKA
jgi:hypothetical protein